MLLSSIYLGLYYTETVVPVNNPLWSYLLLLCKPTHEYIFKHFLERYFSEIFTICITNNMTFLRCSNYDI